jgi:phage terminase Nu1 subunit (DNA packaging protein)
LREIAASPRSCCQGRRVAAELERTPERRLLSKRAVAEHFGVSPRTIKAWREKGCPALRVGRVSMFDVADVDRWLEREAEA